MGEQMWATRVEVRGRAKASVARMMVRVRVRVRVRVVVRVLVREGSSSETKCKRVLEHWLTRRLSMRLLSCMPASTREIR